MPKHSGLKQQQSFILHFKQGKAETTLLHVSGAHDSNGWGQQGGWQGISLWSLPCSLQHGGLRVAELSGGSGHQELPFPEAQREAARCS